MQKVLILLGTKRNLLMKGIPVHQQNSNSIAKTPEISPELRHSWVLHYLTSPCEERDITPIQNCICEANKNICFVKWLQAADTPVELEALASPMKHVQDTRCLLCQRNASKTTLCLSSSLKQWESKCSDNKQFLSYQGSWEKDMSAAFVLNIY